MSTPTETNQPGPNTVWETLREKIPTLTVSEQAAIYSQMRHNARANIDFYVLIVLSSTIAYFGLLQNSGAVVIGAMLVAPLMSPMIAMAHSIVMGNPLMLRRAANSTIAGIVTAIAVGTIFTLILPELSPSGEILARTTPNIYDLCIALASGAAGAYALSRKGVAAALPGVAIAAALVPPLCVVGYGLGSFNWPIAMGALFLFLANLGSILLAGGLVFMALGFRPTKQEHSNQVRRYIMFTSIGLFIIAVPLTFITIETYGRGWRLLAVQKQLTEIVEQEVAEIENVEIQPLDNGYLADFTIYSYSGEDDEDGEGVAKLQQLLSETVGAPVTLRMRVIQASLADYEAIE